ncbi:hypothetical protein [Mycoplasmopsis lipofaciens]|uniref:hypothetical protein n=1 Tax=Mycoplasmopsis lipofaciens TaxID=114884 RepID=UPI0004806CAB|nr:hypothetical protein [Mycoplasmopsis lipofaciens]
MKINFSENKNIKLVSFWDFNDPTPQKIFFWVAAGMMLLLLFALIIWRIATKNKNIGIKNKKRIGSLNKKMNDIVLDLSANKNIKVLYNIIFENKYAKDKHSQLPILAICDSRLFLISNIIDTKKAKIKITNDLKIEIIKNNKAKNYGIVNPRWYNEIEKYISRELIKDKKIKINKILLINEELELIQNQTDFIVSNQFDLINIFKNSNSMQIDEYMQKKILFKLNEINLLKQKVTKV